MAPTIASWTGPEMVIEVQQLRLHPVPFDLHLTGGEVSSLPEVTGEIRFAGQARLAGEGMRLQGHLQAAIAPACARCLEPVAQAVDRELDLLYQPESALAEGEFEVHTTDMEVAFFSGPGVDVAEVAREQVVLALPMQPLCRAECKGLCPQCGANLNQGACTCAPVADERWSALRSLRRET